MGGAVAAKDEEYTSAGPSIVRRFQQSGPRWCALTGIAFTLHNHDEDRLFTDYRAIFAAHLCDRDRGTGVRHDANQGARTRVGPRQNQFS